MILDHNAKGYFTLHVPHGQHDPRDLMGAHGLDYSATASAERREHVLFTKEPYAAVAFYDVATPAARTVLAPISRAICASWATEGSPHDVPDGKELWPFQRGSTQYALDAFARGNGCLVGDEPGLGKTEIAIAAANTIGARRVLVICPAHIRRQWEARIKTWTTIPRPMVAICTTSRRAIPPSKHVHYTITSYDLARSPAVHAAFLKEQYDLLILDEAHGLKTSSSRGARAIFGEGGIASRCAHTLALTGTPLPNRPTELFTLAKGLCWDSIDWMTEHAFQNRFNQRIADITADGRPFVRDTQGRHPELQARLRGNFMVRHLKRDVMLQLKLPVYDLVQAEETGPVKQALKSESLLGIDPENLAGADIKILGQVATVRREMGIALAPQVVEYAEMLHDGGEEKLVIFAWHTEVLDILERGLPGSVRVDGKTSSAQKDARIERFQHDPSVHYIIGNTLSLGTGTDGLQHVAAHCIIAEPDWVPGNNQQCADRLDRGGQNRTVQIDIFVAPNSLAEKVLATALRKLQNIRSALDERSI